MTTTGYFGRLTAMRGTLLVPSKVMNLYIQSVYMNMLEKTLIPKPQCTKCEQGIVLGPGPWRQSTLILSFFLQVIFSPNNCVMIIPTLIYE